MTSDGISDKDRVTVQAAVDYIEQYRKEEMARRRKAGSKK